MEYADIELRLAGSLLNTISKTVSVAEALVVQSINGDGAIYNVVVKGTIPWNDKEERERLVLAYTKEVVERVFPGASAMPKSFADIGLVEAPAEKPSKKV